MRRRTLLKWTAGVVAALGATGGGIWVLLFGDRGAAVGRKVLSPSEMKMAEALAEALFPPRTALRFDARTTRLAERVDEHLATMPARERRYVRAGLRAIEYGSVALHGSRFSRLPLDERIAALRAEERSETYARHTALVAMKGIFGLVFFEIDEVRASLGWTLGCAPTAPR